MREESAKAVVELILSGLLVRRRSRLSHVLWYRGQLRQVSEWSVPSTTVLRRRLQGDPADTRRNTLQIARRIREPPAHLPQRPLTKRFNEPGTKTLRREKALANALQHRQHGPGLQGQAADQGGDGVHLPTQRCMDESGARGPSDPQEYRE